MGIRKWILIVSSIIGLLTVILSLIWYFQKPLVSKFLTNPPKTYSVVRFDSKTPQKVAPQDALTGRGIPDSVVKIFLSPGKIEQDLKTDSGGHWSYTLPSGLRAAVYRLTAMVFDQSDQIVSLKSYQLAVDSQNSLKKVGLGLPEPKIVSAQETGRPQIPQGDWVIEMESLGIVPVIENGEVVLYSQEEFNKAYNIDCSKGCWGVQQSIQTIVNYARANNDVLGGLLSILTDNGYAPLPALEPYFPEIIDLVKSGRVIAPNYVRPNPKMEIDETTLDQYINEAVQKQLTHKYYWSHPDELTRLLIEKTDPIFGINSMIKWATLKPSQLSDEDRVNALLGMTIIFGMGEKLAVKTGGVVWKTALDFSQMIKDMGVVRQAVRDGEVVPLYTVVGRARSWAYDPSLPQPKFKPGESLSRAGPFPAPITKYAQTAYTRDILPAYQAGRAYSISRQDVLTPLAENIKLAIQKFREETGRRVVMERTYDKFIEDAQGYVIPSQFMKAYKKPPAGYQAGDMIVIAEESYFGSYGSFVTAHEMVHRAGTWQTLDLLSGRYVRNLRGWEYGNVWKEKDMAMTAIFELMTDAWANIVTGRSSFKTGTNLLAGGYAGTYPGIAEALYQRLFQNKYFRDEFLEFALTGNSDKLISTVVKYGSVQSFANKFLGRSASDYDKFMYYFKKGKGINWGAITSTGIGATSLAQGVSQDEGILADPAFEFTPDFLSDDYVKDLSDGEVEVIVDSLEGQMMPGSSLTTSVLIFQGGAGVDMSEFTQTWSVVDDSDTSISISTNQVQALVGGANCQGQCQVTLPANLANGNYKLVVYLTKKDSDQILARDAYPFTVGEAGAAPFVSSITINNETVDANDLNKIIALQLPGTEGQAQDFSIPLVVNYSDGSTRYSAFPFDYQPLRSSQPVSQVCTPGAYDNKCSGNCGGCNANAGEQLYRQCSGDGTSWGDWQGQCNIDCSGPCATGTDAPSSPQCTEVRQYNECIGCNTSRRISQDSCGNYQTIVDSQSDGGCASLCSNAAPQPAPQCDDQYYFDSNVDSCIHKFSPPDQYPNCNYVFDHVERNLCP